MRSDVPSRRRKTASRTRTGGFSDDVEARLRRRAQAFANATQGKNAPGRPVDGITYGKRPGKGA